MRLVCAEREARTIDMIVRARRGSMPATMDRVAMRTVYTIGHSTRSSDEFLGLLEDGGVRGRAL
jgi:hypothetical protein